MPLAWQRRVSARGAARKGATAQLSAPRRPRSLPLAFPSLHSNGKRPPARALAGSPESRLHSQGRALQIPDSVEAKPRDQPTTRALFRNIGSHFLGVEQPGGAWLNKPCPLVRKVPSLRFTRLPTSAKTQGREQERRPTLRGSLRIYGNPTGDVSHASNFRSACTASPPSDESTTTRELQRRGTGGAPPVSFGQ